MQFPKQFSKNRVTHSESQDDVTASLPTYFLQTREVQGGELIRSSPAFFILFLLLTSDSPQLLVIKIKFDLIRDEYSKQYKKR